MSDVKGGRSNTSLDYVKNEERINMFISGVKPFIQYDRNLWWLERPNFTCAR